MKAAVILAAALWVGAAFAQRAPNAPDPERVRERIAAVQAELTRNQAARDLIERDLRDLQSQIDRLRVEQQQRLAEQARLQSELIWLQTAPR